MVRINPNDAETYCNRGILIYHLSQFEAVIADYEDVLKSEPENLRTFFNRGLAKYLCGSASEARQDAQIALELADPAKELDSKTTIEQFLQELKIELGEGKCLRISMFM